MSIELRGDVSQRSQPASPNHALHIRVSSGAGEGKTLLSAFDAALQDAGAADFNLIRLSSVIPPHSVIEVGTAGAPYRLRGDRVYAVYADRRSEVPGETVWAGVGWVQQEDNGWGFFAEHDGLSEDEVRHALTATLGDMCVRRGEPFGPIGMAVRGAACDGRPVCVVALALYGAEAWDRDVPVAGAA